MLSDSEKEMFINLKKYIDLHYIPYEQYTSKLNELNKKWKDKIKAKIEEIKEEIKTCYIYKKTGRCTNNCKEACFYYDVIDILQRLLEGK